GRGKRSSIPTSPLSGKKLPGSWGHNEMFLLFSGEGPTDCGVCTGNALICQGEEYLLGPMAMIADQIVEGRYDQSILDTVRYGCVTKPRLVERAAALKAVKKGPLLPGKRRARETAYFFQNARVLAQCAKELEVTIQDEVVAILFRDSDGTA